jgi:hypothetical protein
MCRSLITAVALALGLAACDGYEPPAGGSTSAPINQHPVVAGESNRFFTAASAQSVALAPGAGRYRGAVALLGSVRRAGRGVPVLPARLLGRRYGRHRAC